MNGNYTVIESPEITLEANPDDLSESKIIALSNSPINRLSIGIQSFFEQDLKLMNRVHNALEAKNCLFEATNYFKTISVVVHDIFLSIITGSCDQAKKGNNRIIEIIFFMTFFCNYLM